MTDFRSAVRQLQSAPGFACAVIVTLALTIGANTAMFSLVHAIILRPLPIAQPDQVVALQAHSENGEAPRLLYYPAYAALSQVPVFESLSLYSGGGLFQLDVRGARVEALIEASTPGFFEAMGIRPSFGRFFTTADAPGDGPSAPVVVISHDLWVRAFGGDPAAIGETIRISGTPATVIGVTPPDYKGFYADGGLGFSVPLPFLNRQLGTDPKRPVRGMQAIGRLASGVSVEQARAAVDAVWPTLRREMVPPGLSAHEREEIGTWSITVDSLATGFSSLRTQYGEPLLIVFGVTAALLLLGCVNLGGLLFARTTARQPQIVLCLGLGASRWRITRQLLLENGLLCTTGTVLGLLLAWWATLAAARMLWLGSTPLARSLTPDAVVFAFAAVVAIGTASLVTLLPAWTVARHRPLAALQGSRTVAAGTTRWTRLLLATQIGLSVMLVVGASLLGASFVKLRTMPTGLQHDGLRWSRLFAVPNGYRDQHDATYYPELIRRVSEVPGVQSAALATYFPTYFAYGNLLATESVAAVGATVETQTGALMERVTPRFFETAGIALRQGRDFSWADDKNAPAAAIINESLERALFPGGDAVGRHIRIGQDPTRAAVEIVGVVTDAVIGDFKEPHAPVVFRPRLQDAMSPRAPVLLVRTSTAGAGADAAIAASIDALGREYPRRFYSLDEQVSITLLREHLLASLSSFFGGLGLLLTGIGVYSAFALAAARRSREIAVRMALGSSRVGIASLILRESAVVSLIGVTLGVPLTLGSSRYMASWLYGVAPREPTILISVAGFIFVMGLLACLGPALRASSVDPASALRAE